jgi:protein gp37
VEWVRDIRKQCVSANVPFFFKQWGGRTPKSGGRKLDGRFWDEMPQASHILADTKWSLKRQMA